MSIFSVLKRLVGFLLNPRAQYQPPAGLENGRSFPAEINTSDDLVATSRLRAGHFLSNGPFMFGAIILLGIFIIILIGPLFVNHDPFIVAQTTLPHFDMERNEMIAPPFKPSPEYRFGTDNWGNDLLSLIVYGSRVTLIMAMYITFIRLLLGLVFGSLAGWNKGRLPDHLVMGTIGFITAIPLLISSVILLLILDVRQGTSVFLIALSVIGWTEIAQFVRSELIVIRQLEYIEGAEAVGLTNLQILIRHALPNILPQLLINSFLEMGAVLLLLAELGFLGIFIGGATSFIMDPFGGATYLLLESPEWGALVAQGAPAIRANGYQVLAPTLAFFIVIVGLNSFAEGLRRLLDRAPVSTSFLLRREMALVAAGLMLLTIWVVNVTGPAYSYKRAAKQFDGQQALAYSETLTGYSQRTAGQPDAIAASQFINEELSAFDVQRGYIEPLHSYRVFEQVITMTRPLQTPQLSVTFPDGRIQSFQYGIDFGYRLEGHGGSGQAEAPLIYLGFVSDHPENMAEFTGLDVRGQVVLLHESQAPASFTTEALRRGAAGVIWVSDQTPIRPQMQVLSETAVLQKPTLPVFVVGTAVFDALLQGENITRQTLLAGGDSGQLKTSWFTRQLESRVTLALNLGSVAPVTVPHVIGFLPGYDLERADEVIVLLTSYDTREGPPLPAPNNTTSGTAVMLEMARLLQHLNLDPRRSLLLVAWGGSELEDATTMLNTYLSDIDNYRRLNASTPTGLMHPVAIIELDKLGAGGDRLWIDPDSDPVLANLLVNSLQQSDVAHTLEHNDKNGRLDGLTQTEIPTLVFYWEGATPDHQQDQLADIDPAKLQQAGEGVAQFLIQITRQIDYGRGITPTDPIVRPR